MLFHGQSSIVIASSGRAGSTMLFESAAESLIRSRFGCGPETVWGKILIRLSCGYLGRLSQIREVPFAIYKTHDTFNADYTSDCKFIFVYGDPVESAVSIERVVKEKGEEWFAEHQYHLNAEGPLQELFTKDVLNYEGQLKSWLGEIRDDVLCIDYNDVWKRQDEMSKFLGFELHLPPRRARNSVSSDARVDEELFGRLRRIKDESKEQYMRRTFGSSE